jgi:hypothetical protein
MDWYCILTDYLSNDQNEHRTQNKDNTAPRSTMKLLEQRVVELFKTILQYQMKSVCSYYRNQYKEFFLNLIDLQDWDGARTNVEKAELSLKEDWEQYRNLQSMDLWETLVKVTQESQFLLVDIGQTLENVINQQNQIRIDDQYHNCLRDLRIVTPQDDIERIEGSKEILLKDIYEWIFEDGKYTSFINWDESQLLPCRLLWVKGGAGTGKTMFLIGIIRKLLSQSAVFEASLSYFFCQSQGKTDLPLNNTTAILRSLIWMLLIQQPDHFKHIRQDYNSSGSHLFTDINAQQAMLRIFKEMLKDTRPVYFIVDALDECEQGLEDLIQLISISLSLSNRVRWLVSSRPEVYLLTELKKLHSKNQTIAETLFELDMQSQGGRVEKYMKHKLCDLTMTPEVGPSYTSEIQKIILHEVSDRARDNLLWIFLVFKELKTKRGPYAVNKVKDYPRGLSELYKYKMNRLKGAKEHEQYYDDVLVVMSLAYRPLSLSELTVLLSWSKETDPLTIVKECESFLTIRKGIVSLNHKSVKDYMMVYQSNIEGGVAQGHANICRRSIDAISKLQKNIYDLLPGSEIEDITIPSPDPLEGLQYCCVYWIQHLQESEAKLDDYDQVYLFLQKHLLHWLEALSLMRMTSEGLLAIILLEKNLILVSFSGIIMLGNYN